MHSLIPLCLFAARVVLTNQAILEATKAVLTEKAVKGLNFTSLRSLLVCSSAMPPSFPRELVTLLRASGLAPDVSVCDNELK